MPPNATTLSRHLRHVLPRVVARAGHIICRAGLGRIASPVCPDLIYDRDKRPRSTEASRRLRLAIIGAIMIPIALSLKWVDLSAPARGH
jgi:hypothetical protein